MVIGCGFKSYPDADNATIQVDLIETDWYHIPKDITDIPADSFGNSNPNFIGEGTQK